MYGIGFVQSFFGGYYILGDKWHELGDKVLRISEKSSTFASDFGISTDAQRSYIENPSHSRATPAPLAREPEP